MTTTVYRPTVTSTGDQTINGSVTLNGNTVIGSTSLEAWLSTYTALQIAGTGSIVGESAQVAGASLQFGQNTYRNSGGWKYLVTDQASKYYQNSGAHVFQVSASGSADAAISWTTALTLENNGGVLIAGDALTIATQKTPASAAATGTKGDIVHDTGFVYICTATNTWKRVAIATW